MLQLCYIMALAKADPVDSQGIQRAEHTIAVEARSSVGERHLDVVDVVGSIPSAPTKIKG